MVDAIVLAFLRWLHQVIGRGFGNCLLGVSIWTLRLTVMHWDGAIVRPCGTYLLSELDKTLGVQQLCESTDNETNAIQEAAEMMRYSRQVANSTMML
jgi:hypothetical protein